MNLLVDALNRNPLLLLFLVVALGWPLGKLRIAGASLGMAAVLFVGVALGSIPGMHPLPAIVYELGLAMFVYTIGLSSSQGFFGALNLRGLRTTLITVLTLLAGAALVVVTGRFLHWNAFFGAGLFSGTFTNAPALAGAVEAIKARGGTAQDLSQHAFAYSITYPMGVLVPLLVVLTARRFMRTDLAAEARTLTNYRGGVRRLEGRTVRVTRPEAVGLTRRDVAGRKRCSVVFGRILRDGDLMVYKSDTGLRLGDVITVVGDPDHLEAVVALLGEANREPIEDPESAFKDKRVFVSNPDVVGRPLRELQLPADHDAMVTRLRRGDLWFVPGGDTCLELGDRIKITARKERLDELVELFGDSYRELSETDFLTFSLGLAAGLALGMVPIPLPGGMHFKLGFAGGPLVVALFLGRVNRVGNFVWKFAYGPNLTIRQLGLLLFSAGIGTVAGVGFLANLRGGMGFQLFLAGAAVTLLADLLLVTVGHLLLRIPLNLILGILAGAQTMPVVLSSATEQTHNDLPAVGYASAYPVAMVLKIILAQVLLALI